MMENKFRMDLKKRNKGRRAKVRSVVPTTAPARPTRRLRHPRLGNRAADEVSRNRPAEPVSAERKPAEPVSSASSSGGNLQLYLREIGRVKLLTPQEEIALAARIKKGDEQARAHMIEANLRLVVKIAHEYENMGLPLLDLINEGNIGLIKGVERFDPAKGAKLSTYASWWIKQSIRRALANQSKTIRLPIHVVDAVAHIHRAEMKLHESLDREPTDAEIADELGLDARRVRQYREAAKTPVSLEAPLGMDDDSDHFSEVVADTRAEAPFDQLVKESDQEMVQEVFATLSPRERTILSMRFGLEDDTPRTLEEIGEIYGVTRERIRQIQNEALKKLRTKVAKHDSLAPHSINALAA